MIPAAASVYVATEAVDLRKGFAMLSGLVREVLSGEPRDGSVYVFFGKRGDRLKALYYDGTGACILYKRLDRGRFSVPRALRLGDARVEVFESEFARMFSGAMVLPAKSPRRKTRLMH